VDLTTRDLAAGYATGTVVREVSLRVPAGQIVTILGPNGAGKTTLLRCLARLHPARAGTVWVDDVEVTSWPAEKLARRGVSLVPQGRQLFGQLSVRDNLRVALTGCVPARDHVEQARRLGRDFEALPLLQHLSGRMAHLLSTGEQQLVAIARALIRQPAVLLLDEPTSGLSPMAAGEVARLLQDLRASGVGILLVEQQALPALRLADQCWMMAGGRLIEGPPPSGQHPRLGRRGRPAAPGR
jgi:ABC-type branched-subunit amino acid transport system ATPase component